MVKLSSLTILFALVSTALATLPRYKIRGVNLGSLFIFEPWMCSETWKSMGCGAAKSEWDCVASLGQKRADAAFQKHWDIFITADDFVKMKDYGLNTVRIPVGHWFVEGTIASGENWPRGGMKYLDKVAGLAASHNIGVILDLHGAPGVQVPNNAFTGHTIEHPGFYTPSNYARAYTFLRNITERVHTHPQYRSTFMLEVLNEPEPNHDSLTTTYYPTAFQTIRAFEAALGVPAHKALTIQFMSAAWGAGNPRPHLPKHAAGLAFDTHRYLAYSAIPPTKDDYVRASCSDALMSGDDNRPLVIGEWSLAVKQEKEWGDEFSPANEENHGWYKRWWAAQVQAYEKQKGWVYWSWKAELGADWRWSYEAAVDAGIIPKEFRKVGEMAKC